MPFVVETYKPYDFANRRHIGPSPIEMAHMLRTIGVESLEQLIDETVPEAIRVEEPLRWGPALSEGDTVRRLRAVADKNKTVTSLIGQGY